MLKFPVLKRVIPIILSYLKINYISVHRLTEYNTFIKSENVSRETFSLFLFQNHFNLRNGYSLFSQIFNKTNSLQTFLPFISSSQIMLWLNIGNHSFLCIEFQGTLSHFCKSCQFSNSHIFCLLNHF